MSQKPFLLDSTEYNEGVKFPRTTIGEESIIEFEVKNPYPSRVLIETVVNDPDLEFLFCPQTLEGNSTALIRLRYAPKRTRTESLNGKSVEFHIVL